MRGFHHCEFCGAESPIEVGPPRDGRRRATIGTGEIHVTGEGGTVYAAPTLIVHYLTDHGYSPPQVFQEAALRQAHAAGWTPASWAPGWRWPRPRLRRAGRGGRTRG